MSCYEYPRIWQGEVAISGQVVHLQIQDNNWHDTVIMLHGGATEVENCEISV